MHSVAELHFAAAGPSSSCAVLTLGPGLQSSQAALRAKPLAEVPAWRCQRGGIRAERLPQPQYV